MAKGYFEAEGLEAGVGEEEARQRACKWRRAGLRKAEVETGQTAERLAGIKQPVRRCGFGGGDVVRGGGCRGGDLGDARSEQPTRIKQSNSTIRDNLVATTSSS
jgi:hypothetical protein